MITFTSPALLLALFQLQGASSWQIPDATFDARALSVHDQVAQFIGMADFDTAYGCAAAAKTVVIGTMKDCQLGCGSSGCGQVCYGSGKFKDEVVGCDAVGVQIASGGQTYTITREYHEKIQNQYGLDLIENMAAVLGLQGSVTLKSATPLMYKLADGTEIPAMKIVGRYKHPSGNGTDLTVTVGQGVPALAQVLETSGMGDVWAHVTEIK